MKRLPEALLVSLGVVLRLTMIFNFDVTKGYDYGRHWAVVMWYSQHPLEMPPLSLSVAVYHPPLYYWLAGLLYRTGLYSEPHSVKWKTATF